MASSPQNISEQPAAVATATEEESGMAADLRAVAPSQKVDHARNRYPYCIVWSPLPVLSWLCPLIGHTGIASSDGITYDFAGPYTILEGHMAFGRPTKYWQLSPSGVYDMPWDEAVKSSNSVYEKRMHNICCDNCHSHVAFALNEMSYRGSKNWNMIWIGALLLLHGRYLSFGSFVKTWLPFTMIVVVLAMIILYSSG